MMSLPACCSCTRTTYMRETSVKYISFYNRILQATYNRAVEKGMTEQCYPFRHVYTGIEKTMKRAIPLEAVKRIKNLDLQLIPGLEFARDMFIFSFYTRGMSFIDMAYLKRRIWATEFWLISEERLGSCFPSDGKNVCKKSWTDMIRKALVTCFRSSGSPERTNVVSTRTRCFLSIGSWKP